MDIHKLSFTSAGVSFALGTILLLSFLCTGLDQLIDLGMLYVSVAALINGIFLLCVLVEFFKIASNKSLCFISAGLLLVNIPITLIYIDIVVNQLFH